MSAFKPAGVVFGARGMRVSIQDGVLTFGTRPEKPSNYIFLLYKYMANIYCVIAVPSIGGSNLMSPVKPKVHQTIDFSKAHDSVRHSDESK